MPQDRHLGILLYILSLLPHAKPDCHLVLLHIQSTILKEKLKLCPHLLHGNMVHPLVWPNRIFCSPRNTSAGTLTLDLAPEKSANILLIGTGNPCNGLFIMSSRVIPEESCESILSPASFKVPYFSSMQTTHGITCCDIQPAYLVSGFLLAAITS